MDLSLIPTLSHWESPGDIPFTNTLRNKFVRGVPASLKSFMITLHCRLDLMVGTEANQLENLDAMETIGSWSGRAQVVILDLQRQGGRGYHSGQQNQRIRIA